MKYWFYVCLVIVAVLQSCSRDVYNNESYMETSYLNGKKVAFLPVDVEFTGILPKGYTLEQKRMSEDKESLEIQNIIYREYLFRSAKRKRKQHPVEIINVEEVNSRLRTRGISARNSWSMNADSLGKVIGADLVLRVRVKKDRIMSNAASFGVGVATTVLEGILNKGNNGTSTQVGGGGRTYNIFFDATLSDAHTGTVISKTSKKGAASWSHAPEEVIRYSSGRLAKKGAIRAQ